MIEEHIEEISKSLKGIKNTLGDLALFMEKVSGHYKPEDNEEKKPADIKSPINPLHLGSLVKVSEDASPETIIKKRKKRAVKKEEEVKEEVKEDISPGIAIKKGTGVGVSSSVASIVDEEPSIVTLEDIAEAMRENVSRSGGDDTWLRKLLKEFGCLKKSDLQEENYLYFYKRLEVKNNPGIDGEEF